MSTPEGAFSVFPLAAAVTAPAGALSVFHHYRSSDRSPQEHYLYFPTATAVSAPAGALSIYSLTAAAVLAPAGAFPSPGPSPAPPPPPLPTSLLLHYRSSACSCRNLLYISHYRSSACSSRILLYVCGDTVDSPLQRSDPVLATCQSSTSHSINPDKDAKGSPSWRRVPLLTIRSGYTFQFGEYPPRLDGVSTDDSKQCLQGFCSTAVAFLPPTERSDRGNTAVGHRTRVLQPKGYGGLRPILDLRRFNFSLYKGKFKMLTMRTIMSQVQEGDWFVTIDLKDAYFHIQVVLRHRRFLRFAFGGKAYQYKVLPFGLAWLRGHLPNAWMLHWPL